MPERSQPEGPTFVPPDEISGSERSIGEEIQLSGRGGLHADAKEIAALLGHNDPDKIQEYLDDADH